MGVDVNWNLLGAPVDVGGAFQQGLQTGRANRMQRERDGALRDYYAGDRSAIQRLGAVDPATAAALAKTERDTADYQREGAARGAMSDYFIARQSGGQPRPPQQANSLMAPAPTAAPTGVTRQPNALAGLADPTPVQAMGITQGSMPGALPVNAFGAAGPAPSPVAAGMAVSPGLEVRAPVTVPRTAGNAAADDALMRLARANPEAAFKVQAEDLKTDKARFELAETRLDVIGRLAGSAVDQLTYTAAMQRAQAMGIDVSGLPDVFDPNAVRSMQMQALDGKEQLANARAERKLDWDVEDDALDNDRADRNLGSQIETREGQLSNTRRGQDIASGDRQRGQDVSAGTSRRGQDLSDARGRRGQDLSDSRGRRGQDVTDARGRRGQDVTDRRGRESASFTGTGGKGRGGGAGGTSAARATDPRTGRALVVKNGKWVDEATGKPVS